MFLQMPLTGTMTRTFHQKVPVHLKEEPLLLDFVPTRIWVLRVGKLFHSQSNISSNDVYRYEMTLQAIYYQYQLTVSQEGDVLAL